MSRITVSIGQPWDRYLFRFLNSRKTTLSGSKINKIKLQEVTLLWKKHNRGGSPEAGFIGDPVEPFVMKSHRSWLFLVVARSSLFRKSTTPSHKFHKMQRTRLAGMSGFAAKSSIKTIPTITDK